ncbi:MAG: type I polyketide synthase, partial [Verrucomicrobiota bacterium]
AEFDAAHFKIPPKEAEQMDPQHRLMLECAQTALENAGHDPDRFDGKIGLYCGSSQNSYLLNNICGNSSRAQELAAGYPVTNFGEVLGNDKDFLPSRVAYKLNLKGPAVSVQCACSTSLVSVAQACESLLAGTSDMVLAGGISLGSPQKRDYLYTPDGIASKDGHCRAFDDQATGTVFGEGVGLVVLRRLEDAIADKDNVIAVIRGFALNNDGADKAGYAAPSITGQSNVIVEAHAAAGVSADSIGYVEAHGTGTPLGDPIEIAGLTAAFNRSTSNKQFCRLGTGKTNFGHLDIAAGVTGLIKTALTVQRGEIPPLLHFQQANAKIDFENSPFVPVTELEKWTSEQPRRAGVSAFGVGGTNVHMVLEEAPCRSRFKRSEPVANHWVVPVSASSECALKEGIANIKEYFADNPEVDLAAVASTLQKGRREFSKRAVLVGDSAKQLQDFEPRMISSKNVREAVFMFPGQGSQHPGMAAELYQSEPVFRKAMNRCATVIHQEIGVDLLGLLFPSDDERETMGDQLKNTSLAQPAIFSVSYSLAQLWKHWGVEPSCMIGHSIGEFVAATVAGVFQMEEALKLICQRGRLMNSLPGGAMISVRAS